MRMKPWLAAACGLAFIIVAAQPARADAIHPITHLYETRPEHLSRKVRDELFSAACAKAPGTTGFLHRAYRNQGEIPAWIHAEVHCYEPEDMSGISPAYDMDCDLESGEWHCRKNWNSLRLLNAKW